MQLVGSIYGPTETPYEKAKYELSINIPENYPFAPPKVKFINKIWHPNISSVTGVICLDILKSQWAAAMSLRTILLSIQALLDDPQPDDPQDAVVASQYKNNKELFYATAKHWANVYANGPHKNEEYDHLVQQIVNMGFPEDDARSSLSMKNWNLEEAVKHLLP